MESNNEDLSGTGALRILNFDKESEVLQDAFKIIRTNSLGAYKIDEFQKDAIKKIIKEKSEFYSSDLPVNKLETYSNLERRYISGDAPDESSNVTDNIQKRAKEARQYFSYRGRKYALTIGYDPKNFIKKGNVIEYTLTAPAGFFGMEKGFEKGKVK